MEISLCMIVKNEEDVIQECLLSASGLVDEIIIIDTGSTDSTIEKIGALNLSNVRIEKFEWVNDFSKARNRSLDFATKEWILILDADEVLTYKSKMDLENFVLKDGNSVYTIGIYNHVGKSNVIYSNVMFRLFKKAGAYFEGSIHEKLNITGSVRVTNFATIPNDICSIEHYGYSDEIVKKKNKAERNIDISLKELDKNPKDDLRWYNLAAAYLMERNYEEALKCFVEVERLSVGITKSYHIDAVFKRVDCLIKLERFEDAKTFMQNYSKNEYITLYPDYYYFLGKSYQSMKLYSQALDCFKEALTKDNSKLSFSVKGTNSYISLIEIGRVYMSIGQTQEGIEYILKGIFHDENLQLQGIDDVREYLTRNGAVEILDRLRSLEIKHKVIVACKSRDKNYIKEIATKYVEEGKFKEAKEVLLKYDPSFDEIELNNILSVVFVLESDYDSAELILNKNMMIDSNDFDTNFNLGYVYLNKKLYLQAIDIFEKLLDNADSSTKEEIQEILSNINSLK